MSMSTNTMVNYLILATQLANVNSSEISDEFTPEEKEAIRALDKRTFVRSYCPRLGVSLAKASEAFNEEIRRLVPNCPI
jgi:hypothetical protein